MKLKYISIVILFFMLYAEVGFAQFWRNYQYEFYYGIGVTNFMGDVGAPNNPNVSTFKQNLWVHIPYNTGFQLQTGVKYNFTGRHFAGVELSGGQMHAEDNGYPEYYDIHYENGELTGFVRATTSIFVGLSARYEYLIFKEKRRRTIYRQLGQSSFRNFSMPTYVFAGVGGVLVSGSTSISKPSLEESNYKSGNVFAIAPSGFVGFGFKKKLPRYNIMLGLESSWYLVFSDKLDQPYLNNVALEIGGGEWYDQYQTITFNVIHTFKADRRGKPIIRF